MTLTAALISVGAMLLGYLALMALSKGHPPTGPSLIVLALFVYAILPQGVQVFTEGRFRLAAKVVELPSVLAQQTSRAMVYVVLLVAGGVVAWHLLDNSLRFPKWLLIFAAPWFALTISAFVNYDTVSIASSAFILAGIAVASAPRATTALSTIGYLIGILAAVSIAGAIYYPSAALFPVSAYSDKALFGSQLLAGPLLHPNSLGQTLALGAPFLLSIPNEIIRRASYVVVAIALPLTGSRTSMIAVAAGLLAYAILRSPSWGNRWTYWALATVALAVGPYLVATSNVRSFTGRGAIWSNSLIWWANEPWLGQGPKFYRMIADTDSAFPTIAYHGHNMGVHMLTVGGVLALIALLILVSYVLRNAQNFAARHGAYGIAVFPIILIVDGWLEVPTDFYAMGAIAWVIWVPIAILCKGTVQSLRLASPAKEFTFAGR